MNDETAASPHCLFGASRTGDQHRDVLLSLETMMPSASSRELADRILSPAFACSYCGLKLTSHRAKLGHERLHKGTAFQCYVCRRPFTENWLLQRHLKTVHNGAKDATGSARISDLTWSGEVSGRALPFPGLWAWCETSEQKEPSCFFECIYLLFSKVPPVSLLLPTITTTSIVRIRWRKVTHVYLYT